MSQLPVDSSHLSDHDLLIERYAGTVEGQFHKDSVLKPFFPLRKIVGTDTITNRRIGGTELVALTPGVRPEAQSRSLGKVSLTVDTIVLARDNQSTLNQVQQDFNMLKEIGEDHGKTYAKMVDASFIIQVIKGSQDAAPTAQGSFGGATAAARNANLQLNFGAGKNTQLTSPGDELDADELFDAIDEIVVDFKEADIGTDEMVVVVRPVQFGVLLKNNKLTSTDYSAGNANVAMRKIYQTSGVRIVETPRIPVTEISGHPLSNAANSNAYDVNATDAKAVAVVMHPRSLLGGEAIPQMHDIWYNKEEKQWFIDTWSSYGVTPNRPDLCGCVFKA